MVVSKHATKVNNLYITTEDERTFIAMKGRVEYAAVAGVVGGLIKHKEV